MALKFQAYGPDEHGDYHAGYYMPAAHGERRFTSMANCPSMRAAMEEANRLNIEAECRERKTRTLQMPHRDRRVAHGFYNDEDMV
jgi:hypothetical protein